MNQHTFKYLTKVSARYILTEDEFLEQFAERKAREFYKVPTEGGIIYYDPVTAEQFTVIWGAEKTKARIADYLDRKKIFKANKPVRK